jgi:4-carboxymuconolactone decarboxylase
VPRIPFPTPDTMTPEQRKVYDAVAAGPRGKVQGPLLAALHRPELADKWQQLGELLRYRTTLPARLSEIAILVTAQRWRCQLEWHLHEGFALAAQVPRAVIDDIHAGRRPRAPMRKSWRSTIMRPSCRIAGSCPRKAIGARSACGAWSAWSSSPR